MNPSQWSRPVPRPAQPTPWLEWLVFLFVLAAGLRLGIGTAGVDLDQSWSAVIAWAHNHDAQWGKDIVFTYGPLGWLNCYATYNPQLFSSFVVGQILMTLATALVFGLAVGAAPRGLRLLLALAVVVLAPWLQADVLMLGSLILALAALDRLARQTPASLAAVLATLVVATLVAALSLLKFSLFPASLTLWACAGLLFLLASRGGLATVWLLGVPLAALLLWLGNAQQLSGIPDYLRLSLRMASDFGHAMGTPGPLPQLLAGLASVGLLFLLMAVWWLRAGTGRLRASIVLLHLLLCLYLAWRAAFTRADPAHTAFLMPLCGMLLMALIALSPQQRAGRALPLALAAALVALVFQAGPGLQRYRDTWRDVRITQASLLDLGGLRASFDAGRTAVRAQLDLPATRALVGSERIDLLTSSQGLLLVNEFNYAPRPLFQSYSAYSPPLLRLNEAHFLGPQAPAFVLFKLDTIDLRYPTSEDSLALIALLRNYRPVELERGFVLLQRQPAATTTPLPPAPAQALTARPGEWIDVPDTGADAVILHADVSLSLAGRAYAFALREPATLLETQLSNGEVRQFRIVRGVAQSGFLLSPFLADEREYLRWYFGETQPRVQRIRLVSPTDWQQSLLLQPQFRVGFTALALPRAQDPMPATLASKLLPGFDLAPSARQGMINSIVEDGQPALFMHALATLDFAPTPGRYGLQLTYGVRSAAYASEGCTQADGIRLQIDRLGTQPGQLYQRDINPFARPEDRGPQQASIAEVVIAAGETLRVTVAPGAEGNAGCDWGYVRDLRLQPLPAPP